MTESSPAWVTVLSRRDQFAMAALQGLCANVSVIAPHSRHGWDVVNGDWQTVANAAYQLADCMRIASAEDHA